MKEKLKFINSFYFPPHVIFTALFVIGSIVIVKKGCMDQ